MFSNILSNEILQNREQEREKEDVRLPYYRDTTAIIHSSPFRRLKHKTQVFFAPANDHICTRIEHVLHVASISSTICRSLGLNDDLAWAIGMGHDLGHTPFGHIGEKIISDLRQEEGLPKFEHEINGLRVVDFLSPLNLTYAVRDGIVSHCGESFLRTLKPDFTVKDLSKVKNKHGLMPSTWEGCVVRLSDQIAYMGRDFEDAVRLGIVKLSDMPTVSRRVLGSKNGDIINTLVENVIINSEKEGLICFSEDVYDAVKALINFNYTYIYGSYLLSGYEKYFRRLIKLIYVYLGELLEKYEKTHGDKRAFERERNMLSAGFYNYVVEMKDRYMKHDGDTKFLVFDYISGMSDNFCLDCANEILRPEHLNDQIDKSLTGKWFDIVPEDFSDYSLFP